MSESRDIIDFNFGSITVETSTDINGVSQRTATLNTSLVQRVLPNENADEVLRNLRVRIICVAGDGTRMPSQASITAAQMDYASQRLNEAFNFEERQEFSGEFPNTLQFENDFWEAVGQGEERIRLAGNMRFPNNAVTKPAGVLIPQDRPDRYLLPFDTGTEPDRRALDMGPSRRSNTAQTRWTSGDIVWYDRDIPSLLWNTLQGGDLDTRRTVESTELENNGTPGEPRDFSRRMERLFLPPIVFDIGDDGLLGERPFEETHLSFYALVYYNPEVLELGPPPMTNLPLFTYGMSRVFSATVSGIKTIFPPLGDRNIFASVSPPVELEDPLLEGSGLVLLDVEELDAPNADILQVINEQPHETVVTAIESIAERVYKTLQDSILDKNPQVREGIKRTNYFSDIWFSKDYKEHNRYMFAFDLEAYLLENTFFPLMYQKSDLSRQLLRDTGLEGGKSRVLGMRVVRRRLKDISYIGENNLGTISNLTPDGPNIWFEKKLLADPVPLTDLYLENSEQHNALATPSNLKHVFYEGVDRFAQVFKDTSGSKPLFYTTTKSHLLGRYQYGVEFTVYDAAPKLLQRTVNHLMELKHKVLVIYETITNSPLRNNPPNGSITDGKGLYNYKQRRLAYSLRNMGTKLDHAPFFISYESELETIVAEYSQAIDDYVNFTGFGSHLNGYYIRKFREDHGLIDPLILNELQRVIQIGIDFLYSHLSGYFPSNPLGTNPSFNYSKIERTGGSLKMPIYKGEHYFCSVLEKGKDNNYGYDYIFNEDIWTDLHNETLNGISRINFEEYEIRMVQEFLKYFAPLAAARPSGRDIANDPSVGNAGVRYFSPRIIKTPNTAGPEYGELGQIRDSQLRSVDGLPSTQYPLNSYAQLFTDIIEMNLNTHVGKLNTATEINDSSQIPNAVLYDSVTGLLDTQYEVKISTTVEPQFSAPSVSLGKVPPTIVGDGKKPPGSSLGNWGELLLPSIIGGNPSTDALDDNVTRAYYSGIYSTYDTRRIQNQQNDPKGNPVTPLHPIKLPFAIFGGLALNPILDTIPYDKESFNSLTKLCRDLGLEQNNIKQMIEGILAPLPNQLKNMLIAAATTEGNNFGSAGQALGAFEACRLVLYDEDEGMPDHLTSYYPSPAPQVPPFPSTRDPMKIYAKFLSFWMNFKQLITVEYLADFGNLLYNRSLYPNPEEIIPSSLYQKTQLPVWRPLTHQILRTAQEQEKALFCRVRNFSPSLDLNLQLTEEGNNVMGKITEDSQHKFNQLNLPVYNKYFMVEAVGADPEKTTAAGTGTTTTSTTTGTVVGRNDEEKPAGLQPGGSLGGTVGY